LLEFLGNQAWVQTAPSSWRAVLHAALFLRRDLVSPEPPKASRERRQALTRIFSRAMNIFAPEFPFTE
jgi:hypothetical protein